MTDQSAQEPTMEEILASIRRIISEDDAPAETAASTEPAGEPAAEPETAESDDEPAAAVAEAAPEPEPEPEPEPAASDEEVLELTDRYEAPASESIGDLDVSEAEAEPEPFPAAQPEPAPARSEPVPSYDSLVGDSAAASAASAFAGLAASMRQPEQASGPGTSLEELTRDLLRPMLKDWLDANLPGIVEAQVRKEVERIARG